MTAREIINLLAVRHADDVFVPECKNGPTHSAPNGTLLRMDAWVMAKSWAHPKLTAYEVKVSRSDFLGDDKWRSALLVCNEFWWAVAPGVCDKSEVSPECGLLEASKTGNKLFIRKRPQFRDIEPPVDVLTYILMCRARIGVESAASNADRWKAWLALRDEKKELGWNVSHKIREMVETQIKAVTSENATLRDALKTYERIVPMLEAAGRVHVVKSERGDIPTPAIRSYENPVSALSEARKMLPDGCADALRRAATKIDEIIMSIGE